MTNGSACSFCWVIISGLKADSNSLTIAHRSGQGQSCHTSAITALVGKLPHVFRSHHYRRKLCHVWQLQNTKKNFQVPPGYTAR